MATTAFGKAFRAARNAGDKEFEFGGKKYNTKFKEETSAPAVSHGVGYLQSGNSIEQQRANQGLNEDASGFLDSDKGRKTYEESGKGTVDRQNAALDQLKPMPYTDYVKQQAKQAKGMKHGGSVKIAKGGSASSRGDGIAQRGKTRGTMC